MSAAQRTIFVRGMSGGATHDECTLDSANCFPGMAIEMKANGHYDLPASTQAESLKAQNLRILKEDMYQGKTVTDAYASGAVGFFFEPRAGDHVNVLVVAGENIAVNDLLVEVAAGSGKFKEAAGTEARYRARALEAAGVLAADTLVLCEWLGG